MKCLLVGGTHDGEKIEIDTTKQFFEIVEIRKTSIRDILGAFYEPIASKATFKIEYYERQIIFGNTKHFVVYTLEKMTADQLMERLINNYIGLEHVV